MPSLSSTGNEQKVIVGIADLAVSNNQNAILTTHSLGAGIAVSVFDPEVKVGGLLHVILPDSSIDPAMAAAQPALFMDSGLSALFRAAAQLQAEKHRFQVCVAGGAQIMDDHGPFSVGQQNCESIVHLLKHAHGLCIQADHVGGLDTRSMELDIATGEVRIKISGQPLDVTLWKS